MAEFKHAHLVDRLRMVVAAEQNDDQVIKRVYATTAGYLAGQGMREASELLLEVVEDLQAGA